MKSACKPGRLKASHQVWLDDWINKAMRWKEAWIGASNQKARLTWMLEQAKRARYMLQSFNGVL